jgi:flagellar biosynthesis protein FlhB
VGKSVVRHLFFTSFGCRQEQPLTFLLLPVVAGIGDNTILSHAAAAAAAMRLRRSRMPGITYLPQFVKVENQLHCILLLLLLFVVSMTVTTTLMIMLERCWRATGNSILLGHEAPMLAFVNFNNKLGVVVAGRDQLLVDHPS